MDSIGQLASTVVPAVAPEDTLALIVVAAVAAAMIYLIASFAITRARSRDDRRSSGDQSR